MRDRGAEARDLVEHGLLISRLDRRDVLRHAERHDHRHRCRQANLEPRAGRDLAARTAAEEILIRGPRLARIAELAEMDILGLDAVGEAQLWKHPRLAERDRIDLQIGTGAQQGILPTDPQPPATRLAVGTALQPPAEQHAGGMEHFLDGIERDTADEMDMFGNRGGHVSLSAENWRHSKRDRRPPPKKQSPWIGRWIAPWIAGWDSDRNWRTVT